jgi:hypothetical protein
LTRLPRLCSSVCHAIYIPALQEPFVSCTNEAPFFVQCPSQLGYSERRSVGHTAVSPYTYSYIRRGVSAFRVDILGKFAALLSRGSYAVSVLTVCVRVVSRAVRFVITN